MSERTPRDRAPLPPIEGLAERHVGVTYAVASYYAEAAAVALDRHHDPPTDLLVRAPETHSRRSYSWDTPDDRTKRAHANRDDATEDGAYGLSLSAVEAELGWVAISRAETKSGADYYLAPVDEAEDLEGAYRLEVSGTDSGDNGEIRRRLEKKVQQTIDGASDVPAIAVVVGFREGRVAMRLATPQDEQEEE